MSQAFARELEALFFILFTLQLVFGLLAILLLSLVYLRGGLYLFATGLGTAVLALSATVGLADVGVQRSVL